MGCRLLLILACSLFLAVATAQAGAPAMLTSLILLPTEVGPGYQVQMIENGNKVERRLEEWKSLANS